MMSKKCFLLVLLVLSWQVFLILPVRSVSEQPPAIVLGRYNLFSDNYWIVQNKTAQQLRNEGYGVSGDADLLVHVNYTRLDNTFKSKIVQLSWPNLTLQITEGAHNLNVTTYRIMDDGSIGEKLQTFLRTNVPPYVHPYPLELKDPDLGVGFDPAALTIGNTFAATALNITVNRTETLTGTPWGQNNTYVSLGYSFNGTHSYDWTWWSDSGSGLFLKLVVISRTPTFTSYEEQNLVETGVEADKFDVSKNSQSYQVHVDTNSTISGFMFDPDANRINLTVEGASDTSGVLNVTVPKGLAPAGYGFEVLVDGQATSYTATEDASNYYVGVNYHHSTHTITISFVAVALWNQWWFWPIIIAALAVVSVAAYSVWRRRTKKT